MKKAPDIRFKDFTDAWEQRKVGDVLSENRDVGHSGDIAKKLTVKLWGKGVYAKDDKGSAATQYFTRHAGQFIYSKLDFLNSAFGVVPKELESYESTVDLPAFDCLGVEPYFMFYRAIQPSFYLTNGMIADGSRKAKRIHVETFLDMPLDLPSIEEQQKVASYFIRLDTLITLHQRKLEKLKLMKEAMLDKMFPKEGKNVPEIRIKGFTDDWEYKKLGTIADKVTEKNAQRIYSETFTNSAEFGVISQRDFFDHDISNSENIDGYYVVKENDFVYNPRISVTAPCGPINCNRLGRSGIMSPLYTVFRTHDIDTLYLEWFFNSRCWHTFMYYNGDSGARSDRFSIKNDLFFNMPIPVPTIKEQKKIGEYLANVNSTITLHQRKLEKLKQFKEAMLDKMFI